MQCIFETLSPHLLAAIIPVKIVTYQFNSRKVCSINTNGILIHSFNSIPLQNRGPIDVVTIKDIRCVEYIGDISRLKISQIAYS